MSQRCDKAVFVFFENIDEEKYGIKIVDVKLV